MHTTGWQSVLSSKKVVMAETLTINLSEEQAEALREKAAKSNITLEELVLRGIDEMLSQPDENFQEIADYIVDKNAELYRRLA